jgi:hypothetical protein
VRRSEALTCSFLSQSAVVLRRTIDTSSRAIAFKVSSLSWAAWFVRPPGAVREEYLRRPKADTSSSHSLDRKAAPQECEEFAAASAASARSGRPRLTPRAAIAKEMANRCSIAATTRASMSGVVQR